MHFYIKRINCETYLQLDFFLVILMLYINIYIYVYYVSKNTSIIKDYYNGTNLFYWIRTDFKNLLK